ncbi:hypothetical protein [Streptomyces mashuensis]|uniref:hypothetical protein n=1 Tax=Streptomyces mashuensis TaxID=33904 RepID=UPI00167E46E4|nr:hypothetical protein [Streptomyces mashuensis]
MTWQLSLPDGADQPLSETAARAGITKTAFTRAKRELIAEGYVHEWRRQGPGGRWSTKQLVSNVPLSGEEAAAARDGRHADVTPAAPAAPSPAAGEPGPRPAARSPERDEGDTSHPPHPLAEAGAAALAAVSHRERRLRLAGREVRQLAALAGEWLARGVTAQELCLTLTSGLPAQIHSPAGIVRDRLLRKMPAPPGPVAEPPAGQPCGRGCGRTFTPVADETWCRDCRVAAAAASSRRGARAVRAALRGPGAGRPVGRAMIEPSI